WPWYAGEVAGPGEDGVEHLLGQLPGEGVLLTRVERAQDDAIVRGGHLDTVTEAGAGPDREEPGQGVVGELPEHDEHLGPVEQRQLPSEKGKAGVALLRGGSVGGRRAAHRGRDVRAG